MAIKILMLVFLMLSSSNAQWAVSPWEYSPLEKALLQIRHEPGTDFPSLTRKEKKALALLKSHTSPSEQAAIYSSIALSYSENGWSGADSGMKSAKYCEEALKFPVDAATAAQLYIYWAGDISLLEKHNPHPKGETLASNGKKVSVILIKGLAVALDNLTQDKHAQVPGVMKFDCGGNCEAEIKEHAQQMAERKRVQTQNKLIEERDDIIRQIVDKYFPFDNDNTELKQLASEVLTSEHSNTVPKIINAVALARAEIKKQK